jgi:hypothetical protein
MCSETPAISGARRPTASETGPISNWPSARPASVPVSVSWTAAAVVCRSSVMVGSAGRYMSMVSGPIAMRIPSTPTRRRRCRGDISSPGVAAGAVVRSGAMVMVDPVRSWSACNTMTNK